MPAGISNGSISVVTNATNPDLVIDINGYYAPSFGVTLAQGTAAAPSLSFSGDSGTGIFSTGTGLLDFTTGGTDHMRLDGSGNLAVTGNLNLVTAGTGIHFGDTTMQTTAAAPPPVRTVVVSPLPGPATAAGARLLQALSNITTNSSTNPWVIKLEPGLYDLNGQFLTMKPCVDIEGSGEGVTGITTSANQNSSSVATVIGASNSELRFLTVSNVGLSGHAYAFIAIGTSPRLTHVTCNASVGGDTVGIVITSGASVVLKDVTVTATTDSISNVSGVLITNASAVMQDVNITISGTSSLTNASVFIEDGSATIQRLNANAAATGLYMFTSLPGGPVTTVENSTISGNGVAIQEAGSGMANNTLKLQIATTRITGTVTTDPLGVACAYTYNGSFAALNSVCK